MQGLEAVKETKSEVRGTSERAKDGGEPVPETSLSQFLVAAREKRGLSREEVVKQSRIPEHYLKMLESNDCSMISDQLYLLPFLRRYSTFLQVDPEETAMRFVHEVQRADKNQPTRIDTPLEPRRRKRRNWSGIAIVTLLLAVIVAAYLAESRYRGSADNTAPAPAVSAATVAAGATAATAKPETAAPSSSGVTTGASQNPPANDLGQKSGPPAR